METGFDDFAAVSHCPRLVPSQWAAAWLAGRGQAEDLQIDTPPVEVGGHAVETPVATMSRGGAPWLAPCHQLDFGTSGLLVLAKSPEALRTATLAFDGSGGIDGGSASPQPRARVEKEYLAVVIGWPEWDEYDWRGQMDVEPASPFKVAPRGVPRAAPIHQAVGRAVACCVERTALRSE